MSQLRIIREINCRNMHISLVTTNDFTEINTRVLVFPANHDLRPNGWLSTTEEDDLPQDLVYDAAGKGLLEEMVAKFRNPGKEGMLYRSSTYGLVNITTMLLHAIPPIWNDNWHDKNSNGAQETYDQMQLLYDRALLNYEPGGGRETVIARLGYGYQGQYNWPAATEAEIAFGAIKRSSPKAGNKYESTDRITIVLSAEMGQDVEDVFLYQFHLFFPERGDGLQIGENNSFTGSSPKSWPVSSNQETARVTMLFGNRQAYLGRSKIYPVLAKPATGSYPLSENLKPASSGARCLRTLESECRHSRPVDPDLEDSCDSDWYDQYDIASPSRRDRMMDERIARWAEQRQAADKTNDLYGKSQGQAVDHQDHGHNQVQAVMSELNRLVGPPKRQPSPLASSIVPYPVVSNLVTENPGAVIVSSSRISETEPKPRARSVEHHISNSVAQPVPQPKVELEAEEPKICGWYGTTTGTPCKRRVRVGKKRCHHHKRKVLV